MPYRPRFTIYQPALRLRFPRPWTVLDYYDEPAPFRSRGAVTRVYQEGRKYIKPLSGGHVGVWRVIRSSSNRR